MLGREYGGEQANLTAEQIASLTIEGRGGRPREAGNPDVVLGASIHEGVWVSAKTGQPIHVRMDLPGSAAGARMPRPTARVFTGAAADTDVVAFTTADGAAWLAVAHGPGAPTRFGFTIALPEGMALEPMPSGGLDFMHPHYGATVGRLYRPWASDAMFRPLPAEYHVREPAVLTVNVDAAGASYPFVVGVVYGASPR
ncbi:hypothetical protein GCM10009527_039640 [Actinomadura nitritigenes]